MTLRGRLREAWKIIRLALASLLGEYWFTWTRTGDGCVIVGRFADQERALRFARQADGFAGEEPGGEDG